MKGIGFFERHIEKVVLAVLALVFMGVLAMQFTLQPNQIDINGQKLPPERAFEPVRAEAERLRANMNETDPELPVAPAADLASRLESGLSAPVVPSDEIAAFGPQTMIDGTSDVVVGDAVYAALDIPAPTGVRVHSFVSTLHPVAVKRTEGLAELVPEQQPFDKSAVSVEASFDGVAFRGAFEHDPDADGPLQPFPLSWRREVLLGVEYERQKLGLDGDWSEPETVEPMSGSNDLLGRLLRDEALDGRTLASATEDAMLLSDDILRPAYPAVIAGDAWKPPSAFDDSAEPETDSADPAIQRKLADLREIDGRIERQQRAIERRRDSNSNRPPPNDPGGGRDPRGNNPPPGGGGGSSGDDRRLQNMEASLERMREDREALLAELSELGWEQNPSAQNTDDTGWSLGPVGRLVENSDYPLWSHDLRVDPGATYRYRARVAAKNPAYGQGEFLQEDQRSLADAPVVYSPWSEWSDPVEVLDSGYFFVTGASDGNDLSPTPSASVEVYQFYYGYWRKAEVRLEPGDVIAGEIRLDNPELAPIYDLSSIDADTQIPPGGAPDPNTNPPPIDPRDDPRNDPRGRPGQAPDPGGDPGSAPTPRQRPTDDRLPNLPSEPGPDTLSVLVDATLLDVAPWLSGGTEGRGDVQQVFLRDQNGRIVSRRPDLDRRTALFQMVDRSAREAERLGSQP